MKGNKKLTAFAGKFLPRMHGRYLEMCSLAAIGQLGGPQMSELNEHIASCDSCREFLESVAQASVQVMPVLAESRVAAARVAPPEGLRARFLCRLAAEVNTKNSLTPIPFPLAMRTSPHSVTTCKGGEMQRDDAPPAQRLGSLISLWRPATVLGTCAIVGIAGFYMGHRTSIQTVEPAAKLSPPSAPSLQQIVASEMPDRIVQLEQENAALTVLLGQLRERLAAADAQQRKLGERLADANKELAALSEQEENARQIGLQEDQRKRVQIATLQSAVETLHRQLENSKTKLAAQQNQAEELRAKLELTEANLQQELSLKSAKSDMGELVAARNLHIVDVYDAGPNGKRQRSFGRVFYIEGKSLVFYAYDLEDVGQFKTNLVFHVWGGRAGVKEVTHSLGILRKDDDGQNRWAMTFDDPKVLAQINSVFVTAESGNQHYAEPHGKKVLYAYFGSPPNHP